MRDESVEDIRISEMIPKQEKEESRESDSGTTININGDLKGLQSFFSAITIEKHGIDKWDDAIEDA